jgi:integrase
VFDLLFIRCGARKAGWVFASKLSKSGHSVTIAKQFRKARESARLPESVVLYSARHTFGTVAYRETGNLKLVMDVMGHADVRTAMRYQHPEADLIRDVINRRNAERHNPRHKGEEQVMQGRSN